MARKRAVPNFLYATLGLAVVGTGTYFAVRAIRRRNAEHGEGAMMSLRRSTRDVGRAVKDSVGKLGKDARRGIEDTGEALTEVGDQLSAQADRKLESDAATSASYNRI